MYSDEIMLRNKEDEGNTLVFKLNLVPIAIFVLTAPVRLLVQRKCQETGLLVASTDLKEDDPLALLPCCANSCAHVLDGRNRLAVQLDDDVAALYALIGGFGCRIDARYGDAFLCFAAWQLRRRNKCHAEVFNFFASVVLVAAARKGNLLGIGKFPKRHGNVALNAIAGDMQVRFGTRRQRCNGPGKLPRVGNGPAIDLQDDILLFELGFRSGSVGQDLCDQSALRGLERGLQRGCRRHSGSERQASRC